MNHFSYIMFLEPPQIFFSVWGGGIKKFLYPIPQVKLEKKQEVMPFVSTDGAYFHNILQNSHIY